MTKQEKEIWQKPMGELNDKQWKIFLKLLDRKEDQENAKRKIDRRMAKSTLAN
jgi:hypothetical protein